MRIELEVSDKNEATSCPWWIIIDPKQTIKPDPSYVAMCMIDGPYFSREEAEEYLKNHRYNYSKRAIVWCASGFHTIQYREQCNKGGLRRADNAVD